MKHYKSLKLLTLILSGSLLISEPLGLYASELQSPPKESFETSESQISQESSEAPETGESQDPQESSEAPETGESQDPQESSEAPETSESQSSQETTETQETDESQSSQESSEAPETSAPPESDESQSTEESESTLETEEILQELADTSDHTTAGFVRRLYKVILLRDPDPKGLKEWVHQLENGIETGAEVTRGFVFSDEFKKHGYSNERFVEIMYTAILGRKADDKGKAAWVEQLDIGFTRMEILRGFIESDEFTKLCDEYGIIRGSIKSTEIVDQNPKLTRFVSRLYTIVLQRKPDPNGLSQWVSQLYHKKNTAAQVVSGFTDSNEFKSRTFTDEEYISILYNIVFGRNADPEGLATWKGNLDAGMSRNFILYHLVYSDEFTKLCNNYGVIKGEIKLTEPRDLNKDLTVYVNTTFRNCLGRSGSADDLNLWTQQLSNHSVPPSEFIMALLFSAEANAEQLSNEAFIRLLFSTALHRQATSSEVANWCNDLANAGNDRKAVAMNIIYTEEYQNLIGKLGFYEGNGRRYQNPEGYYQIQDSIAPLAGGGYELGYGYMGLKVYRVQKRLGINNHRAIVDVNFMNEVKRFQSQNGLKVDGIVGLNTWRALGFSDYDWYNIGTYISPMRVDKNSTRNDHIEAMISTAYQYLGNPYIIGASGAPGTGVDCSGLVMQGLYSAGIDLSPINPVRHSYPGYEYESRNMFASPKFKSVPYAQRQRGDLIFYQNSVGTIIHVAIYLGNDQVIEAWPPQVVVWPIVNAQRANIAGVRRPFI